MSSIDSKASQRTFKGILSGFPGNGAYSKIEQDEQRDTSSNPPLEMNENFRDYVALHLRKIYLELVENSQNIFNV